jgi:hypothetical protein
MKALSVNEIECMSSQQDFDQQPLATDAEADLRKARFQRLFELHRQKLEDEPALLSRPGAPTSSLLGQAIEDAFMEKASRSLAPLSPPESRLAGLRSRLIQAVSRR